MAFPAAALAAAWICFVVAIVLCLILAIWFVRHYQKRSVSERAVTFVATLSLSFVLLTIALVPVDVYLVSSMKHDDGTFKPWAETSEQRADILDAVTYGYYVLYCVITVFAFFILPFTYFYYEEDEEGITTRQRMCEALKYTAGFIVACAVLLLVGAFVPMSNGGGLNGNSTLDKKLRNLAEDLSTTSAENALSFVVSVLTMIGAIFVVIYLGYGLAALPINLFRGFSSAKSESVQARRSHIRASERARSLRAKYMGGGSQSSSRRERTSLRRAEEEERLFGERSKRVEDILSSKWTCCLQALKPFTTVFGIIFFLISLFLWITLLLSCLDRTLNSVGYKLGFALDSPKIGNPIDKLFVIFQSVFPLDYVVFGFIVLFLILCMLAGMRRIDIWCCWIRMYKVRPHRTEPQGVLFVSFLLIFSVLFLNTLLVSLAPQYVTFGSQKYQTNCTVTNSSSNATSSSMDYSLYDMYDSDNSSNTTSAPTVTYACHGTCNFDAIGKVEEGACPQTRITLLLNRFSYKIWFFGVWYFGANWLIVGMFFIGVVHSCFKRKRSLLEDYRQVDSDTSDEEMLT